jgi:hypothetical protein
VKPIGREGLGGACIAGSDGGFTIVEALVAMGIAVLVAFTALAACVSVARALQASTAGRGAGAVETQLAQLRADAASALAVWVPSAGTDGGATGNEIDFSSKTDAGRAIRWRYVYDPAGQTLTRSDYDDGGLSGVRDPRTGIIDPAATYPPLRRVTRFAATALAANRLGDPERNVYSGIGRLLGRTPTAISVPLSAAGGPAGGNGVVAVELADAGASGLAHLSAGALPTGFTVTGAPVWHAVVYRVDQTHRSWLGVAGKSHVFINARIDVSYDGWKTPQTWCDFNVFGNPDGLDGHDPHADYKPNEPEEQSAHLLAACESMNPIPPTPAPPGGAPAAPATPAPIVVDTPPPCWSDPGPAGRCWPPDAPSNWTPPGLSPGETPPPPWCASHPQSPACPARPASG